MYVFISCSHVGKTINSADKARRVFSQSKPGLRPDPLAWGSVWGLSALFYWSATLISNNRASLNICFSHPPPSLKLVKVSEGRSERHDVVRLSRGCLWLSLVLQCRETRPDRVFPARPYHHIFNVMEALSLSVCETLCFHARHWQRHRPSWLSRGGWPHDGASVPETVRV